MPGIKISIIFESGARIGPGKAKLLECIQRDGAMLGEAGFRLVMPGDKRGGRNVRDVVAIAVE